MTTRHTVVVSDLHISAGALDDCDPALERHFCEFLRTLGRRPWPISLVLNGDFLDFVQAAPADDAELESDSPDGVPLCFTEEQSLALFNDIRLAHGPILRSLGAFLDGHPLNEVVILPGNHDADFFWPSVRREFVRGVGPGTGATRIRFHLEQVYVPDGAAGVWIEHGHQHDPLNTFALPSGPLWSSSRPPILRDRAGVPRLFESAGTRFMMRFFNRLNRQSSFGDSIGPLCRLLATIGADALDTGRDDGGGEAALVELFRFFVTTLADYPAGILSADPRNSTAAKGALARLGASMGLRGLLSLSSALHRAGFPLDRPLPIFISDLSRARKLLEFLIAHPDLLQSVRGFGSDRPGSERDRTGDRARLVGRDIAARLERRALALLQASDAALVVMGHLHDPVRPSPGLRYANTGCWGTPFNAVVRSGDTGPVRMPYLEIPPRGPEASQLIEFAGALSAACEGAVAG